jgi:hypothetical protein
MEIVQEGKIWNINTKHQFLIHCTLREIFCGISIYELGTWKRYYLRVYIVKINGPFICACLLVSLYVHQAEQTNILTILLSNVTLHGTAHKDGRERCVHIERWSVGVEAKFSNRVTAGGTSMCRGSQEISSSVEYTTVWSRGRQPFESEE